MRTASKQRLPTISDPRELPNYGLAEAAHYLRIPLATLRDWACGCHYETKSGSRRSKPLMELPQPGLRSLSFFNLVEAVCLPVAIFIGVSSLCLGEGHSQPPALDWVRALEPNAYPAYSAGTGIRANI